tara:strand:+ start:452 stop:733 length:282 start_codon:yes stop_codon:yes gene_type:complete
MEIKLIKNSFIPKMLKVDAITIYPFIFFASKTMNRTILSHELIHINQVETYGWFRFYSSYAVEYLSYRLRGDSPDVAYNKISYEIEAYRKQDY